MRLLLASRWIALVLGWFVLGAAARAQPPDAAEVLKLAGRDRGICALLGDRDCRLAIALARSSQLTLFVQLPDADQSAAACRAADEAGLYGLRVFVDQGTPARIGLADNVADCVVLLTPLAAGQKAEILRVLRPEGKALCGRETWTKPFPEGVDDWPHHYHGPDNNPQSRDRLARSPYLTQFVAEPRYAPGPQVALAAGGRVFMAFGHFAWHEREEPWLDTLLALNAFNGTLLWRRPLRSGIMIDRSTMIATRELLYLADDRSCKRLDAATGKLRDEIVVPADLGGGTFWKWMALEGGTLYTLVGPDEPPDPVARWRSTRHGWPWTGISKGYNEAEYAWGFGRMLVALDPQTKRVLWHHQEDPPIDSRSLCMTGGRIYFGSFGQYLACLDAKTGSTVWRRTPDRNPEVFEAIGPYRPGHGYVGGWKSTVYMKCTEKALYIVGPQVEWLTALSAADGRVLWKHPAKDLHIVVRDDGLYAIGPQKGATETKKLDPLTGEVLATYPTFRRACTRSTGTADGIFFRGHEGSGRFDLASGQMQWVSPMRPSCHVGVIVAAGHLYWVPWACDCNLQMFGAIALGPAGSFAFDQPATATERLQRGAASSASTGAKIAPSADDWPTYRADNRRSAQSRATVGRQIGLAWKRSLPDVELTAPVAAGGLVFLAGSDGIVRALDAAGGQPRWTAYVGGPVKYPPTVAGNAAYVGSGDGRMYCLDAGDGRLRWRFRAAPAERRIPVYGKLVSTWPVNSGVLVEQGVAYFAAGMTDFDGTHVYALDAEGGKIRWQNNTCGHLDTFGRRGVACQGELLLADGRLYLAGGNAASPGVFELDTGRCLTEPPREMGTRAVRGRELRLVDHQVLVSGQPLFSRPDAPVYDKSTEWQPMVVVTRNAALRLTAAPGEGSPPAWVLSARGVSDDKPVWEHHLPAAPVRWGIAVDAAGRIVLSLVDGQVLCLK